MIHNVVLLGAGNLATQLAKALSANGIKIISVYSRTETSAQKLANIVNSQFCIDVSQIPQNADLYILATSDSAHLSVLQALTFTPQKLVHTAGSVPLEILNGYAKSTGVFYPFQTFSKSRNVSFKNIPVLIESKESNLREELLTLAGNISDRVEIMESDKRKFLHLSAVFVCNFVNHLYDLGQELTNSAGIDFSLLHPLIMETAEKIKTLSPREAQTGPAVRMDTNIIGQQEALLNEKCPDLVEIYSKLSRSIFNYANK